MFFGMDCDGRRLIGEYLMWRNAFGMDLRNGWNGGEIVPENSWNSALNEISSELFTRADLMVTRANRPLSDEI